MFSPQVKKHIADEVQKILQNVSDMELPLGEISFILHVDGAESWSWANIFNDSHSKHLIPFFLAKNFSVVDED